MSIDLRQGEQVLHQRLHAARLIEHGLLHVEPGLAGLVQTRDLASSPASTRAAQLVARVREERSMGGV